MNFNYLNYDESLEEWRDVKGYEGYYEVSNYGRVRSLPRNTTKGRIIKPYKSNRGYLYIVLSKDNKQKTFNIHRLVAQAFIPNPNGLPQVNHKDENPSNNRVENLEWCTAKYNSNYGTHNEKLSEAKKGFKHTQEAKEKMHNAHNGMKKPWVAEAHSKLVGQFDMDMNLIATFPSTREAARQLKYPQTNVSRCCRGVLKSYHNYIFRYL